MDLETVICVENTRRCLKYIREHFARMIPAIQKLSYEENLPDPIEGVLKKLLIDYLLLIFIHFEFLANQLDFIYLAALRLDKMTMTYMIVKLICCILISQLMITHRRVVAV